MVVLNRNQLILFFLIDFQDSAFFDDSERLLRISNTTSSSSSTSNQTESEPANGKFRLPFSKSF